MTQNWLDDDDDGDDGLWDLCVSQFLQSILTSPSPLQRNYMLLWLLSWMVPLTVNTAATIQSSSCVHDPRAVCIYRPCVGPGIFDVGLCLQTLPWVLDDSYIMYRNATYCIRSWSFRQKYNCYLTHVGHVSVLLRGSSWLCSYYLYNLSWNILCGIKLRHSFVHRMYIQGVTGGTDQTSGGCCLC